MITCRLYREGRLGDGRFDPNLVSDYLAGPGNLVWLDVEDPTEDDVKVVAEEFGLHEEAVRDLRERRQRTKVDQYGTYFFVVAYAMSGEPTNQTGHEIHILAGERYLITFRYAPVFGLTQVLSRWDAQPKVNVYGGGALLYVLLDEIVDTYFPILDEFDTAANSLEDRVFADVLEPGLQKSLFRLKKSLVQFRGFIVPLRDILDFLQGDVGVVKAPLRPYFSDIYDNVYRAIESVDNGRETLTAALSAYQAAVGNNMNVIMKKLTAWATILLVPTVVGGIYGMNFEYMPELHVRWGYFAVLGFMAAACSGLWVTFKKRKWL